ncbi:hypothetical protein K435DRAFT_354999 [Dendrothele bispora CBS 962.96]|uniref:PWWP domain-containing protein n=1 Tax=Dendrothele bispora (strain CBS 962.96) TaxID=1314807 RepID=A0A4S8LF54_DENBC|nr:hypothetical protein K435DRAFT_354999 [Dendrothele bispora CBS 962.96]
MSKKGAKAPKEVASYDIRDIVLGKVRGFPPWPGMVVEPSAVPPGVLKERPANKKTVFYCVQFFPTGDYAWLLPKDISKLQRHEIESYINEPFKRSGDLLNGYRIALDPIKWEQERLAMQDAAGDEEEEDEMGGDEVDQLDSGDDDGKSKQMSKKRKRESESGISAKGKASKATKAKKEGEAASKKPRASTGKSKKNGKSKEMVESEDDADAGDDGPSKKASPPPTKKAKKDNKDEVDEEKMAKDPEAVKVRDWRHRLQKTFLSNKAVPKEQDMPGMDQLFAAIESYDKMNIEYLQFSKIGKVMRHITALDADRVPKDEEFKFRERAKTLVDKWHQILGPSSTNKTNGTGEATATNGPGEAKPNGVNGSEEGAKDVSMADITTANGGMVTS